MTRDEHGIDANDRDANDRDADSVASNAVDARAEADIEREADTLNSKPEPREDVLWRDDAAPRKPVIHSAREIGRYWWRQLTSMRTALILLFLLAVASVPGSLLPQRNLSPSKIREYYADHPTLAPWVDRLGLFEVFSSPWYAAIYLLLFISLVGCLVPRISIYLRAVRAKPPKAPRNLSRFAEYADATTDLEAGAVLDDAQQTLRGRRWRVVRRQDASGETLSAEKGYLQEAGNLVFHLSLLGLLIALAVGKVNGYEATRIAIEGEEFCNTQMAYDSFAGGTFVDGADMADLCITLNSFETVYEPDLTPAQFLSDVNYGPAADSTGAHDVIGTNDPLRTNGVRAYVTGHGYAPVFTIEMPDGTVREEQAPFLPSDQQNFGSEGALKIDTGDAENSLAMEGFLAPTAQDAGDGVIVSTDPRLLNPMVALFIYQGYTGLDTGVPQSVYTLDQQVIEDGLLERVESVNLSPGESVTLPDGTTITFDRVAEWAAFQISHDPAQGWVLAFAITALIGLMGTLFLRRRRLWVRVRDVEDGVRRIEVGGLAHSGHAAFGYEFAGLRARILYDDPAPDEEA
ncbi:MAG: cytochrome c biogenesis protein ResB [Cumulibacter sp.]